MAAGICLPYIFKYMRCAFLCLFPIYFICCIKKTKSWFFKKCFSDFCCSWI